MAGDLVVELQVQPAGYEGPHLVAVTKQGVRGVFVQRAGETVAQLLERATHV
jgi:hypothetical protein